MARGQSSPDLVFAPDVERFAFEPKESSERLQMTLAVYLPALNEAASIGAVLDGIPKSLPGIDCIKRIVIALSCPNTFAVLDFPAASLQSTDPNGRWAITTSGSLICRNHSRTEARA